MDKKRLVKVFALLPCLLLMSGCWDSRDINDRDISTAVIVDKTESGFTFYLEIPPVEQLGTPQGGGSGAGQQKPKIVKSEGRTIAETRENLDYKMDRPVFLGAVQTVILTDGLATYGTEEYMQRLRQIPDYRKTVDVVVTTEEPQKLLETTSEHSLSAGTAIYDTIESLINQGQLFKVPLMEILERLSSSYKRYDVPTVALIDGDPTFTGLTVFSGGIKTGFIPAAEVRSIVFMQAKKAKLLYTVPYKDEYAIIQVTLPGKKVKAHDENGKISFDINLKFKGVLLYKEKSKPLRDDDIAVIQATLKAMLEKEFTEMYRKSQTDYKVDCFSLFEEFQNAYPEEYKKMDWAGEYSKAPLNLSVSVKLHPTDFADYKR